MGSEGHDVGRFRDIHPHQSLQDCLCSRRTSVACSLCHVSVHSVHGDDAGICQHRVRKYHGLQQLDVSKLASDLAHEEQDEFDALWPASSDFRLEDHSDQPHSRDEPVHRHDALADDHVHGTHSVKRNVRH